MLVSISQRILWGSVFAVSVSWTLGGSGILQDSRADGNGADPKTDGKTDEKSAGKSDDARAQPSGVHTAEPLRPPTAEYWAEHSSEAPSLRGDAAAADGEIDLTPTPEEMSQRLAQLERMKALAARIGQEPPVDPQEAPRKLDVPKKENPPQPGDKQTPPGTEPGGNNEAPPQEAGDAHTPTSGEANPTTGPATPPPSTQRIGRRTPEEVKRDAETSQKRMEEARRKSMEERARREAERAGAHTQPGGITRPLGEAPRDENGKEIEPGDNGHDVQVGPDGSPPKKETNRIYAPSRRGTRGSAAAHGQPATRDATATVGEQPVKPPPAEAPGKNDWIAFKDEDWESVIEHIAKRIGKPYRSDVGSTPTGTLTYENPRIMTKDEALDELNYLLVAAGYFIVETEYYIYCVPISEAAKFLTLDKVFDSIEAFTAANPRDLEYVSVSIQIKDMPAEELCKRVAPAMPDYALPTYTADTNTVKVVGFAEDVRRFEALRAKVSSASFDPRTMQIYKIKTNVQVVEQLVRGLLDVAEPQRRYDPQKRQFVVEGEESATKIIADPRTNTLIVKATSDDQRKVKELIDRFDDPLDIGEFTTTVIPVKNASATEIASLLSDILNQERGETRPQFRFQPRPRPGQPPQPNQPNQVQVNVNPEDILGEDIYERAKKTVRLKGDDRTNSLIVYANKDGLEKVRELLEIIDKPVPSNYSAIVLKYAKPSEVQPLVEQITRGMIPQGARGQSRQTTIVADDANQTLHVVAEHEVLDQINELIAKLDIPGAEDKEHRVELVNLKPSDIAPTIQELLSKQAVSAAAPGRNGRNGRGGFNGRRFGRGDGGGFTPPGGGNTQQIISLDAIRTLIVFCTDADWEKVRETIEAWDSGTVSDKPETRFFTVKKGNPAGIVTMLQGLYRQYRHPILGQVPVYIDQMNDQVVVQSIKPVLDEIDSLIKTVDLEDSGMPLVIIPIDYADANQLATLVQAVLQSRGFGPRRGGNGPNVQADPATNTLVFQGDQQSLQIVQKFVKDYESKLVNQAAEKRSYTIQNVNAQEVLNALTQFYVSNTGFRGPRGQVKVVQTGNQVLVEAPKEKFPEIEKMIHQIDVPPGAMVTEIRAISSALDVNMVANTLSTIYRARQRPDRLTYTFTPDPNTQQIIATVPKDSMAEVDDFIKKLGENADESGQIKKFFNIESAEANYVADQVRQLLTAQAGPRPRGGVGIAERVRIVVDTRQNRLAVYAPTGLMDVVESLIKELDTASSAESKIQIIHLEVADAQSVAQTIQTLWQERFRNIPGFRVTAEPISNSIFANGLRAADLEELKALVKGFDEAALATKPVTRVFEPKNGNPWEIVQTLQARYQQLRGQRWAVPLTFTVLNGEKIVAMGPGDKMDEVAAIVAQLTEVAPPPPMKNVELKNADANTVAGILTNVLAPKMRVNRELKVVAEPLSNMIIVSGASANDFEDIRKWAEQLDQAVVKNSNDVRIRAIEQGNPQEIVNVLTQRYVRAGRRTTDGPSFTVIGQSNIVVVAPPAKMDEIMKMVDELDTVPGDTWKSITIAPKYADPNEMKTMIDQLWATKGSTANQKPTVTVANGTLIVRGPEKVQSDIKELVSKIDREDINAVTVQIFNLKNMSAGDLEMKVNLFLSSLGNTTRKGSLKPGCFADRGSNTLVVLAPKEYMGLIENLINSIDSKEFDEAEMKPYALKFAKADAIAPNVETMLKSKSVEIEGAVRSEKLPLKVVAEAASNRLFVFAPDTYQDLAAKLIKTIDTDVDTGQITRVIQLNEAQAQSLAQSVATSMQVEGKPAAVAIVPDAGSNSIILSGLPREVAEAEKRISEVETLSKSTPEMKIFHTKNTSVLTVSDALKDIFPESKNPNDNVTISEDEFYDRMIVTASRRKMRQVEEYVKMLDVAPDEGAEGISRQIYFVDITRGDATDIAFDVEDNFPSSLDGGPEIDADWDGEYIKVRCRPSEFPKIEELIQQYEARAKVKITTLILKPKGGAAKYLPLLQAQNPNLRVITPNEGPKLEYSSLVEDLWPEGGPQPKGVNVKAKDLPERGDGAKVVPTGVDHYLQDADDWQSRMARELIRAQATDLGSKAPDAAKPAATQPAAVPTTGSATRPAGREATITDVGDGRIIISGDEKRVDDLRDAIELLEEDLTAGEVVRIFRFRYGDVTAAARILELMFNESAQYQGAAGQLRLQQQMMNQQMQMQQNMQQAAQRNQGGGEGPGRGDRGGRSGRNGGGGGLMDSINRMTGMMPGGKGGSGGASGSRQQRTGGGDRLRIATDISHNYLIVKCDESDLPEIRQLLREMDIPPANVDMKVIQLKHLDATEVANNIKEAFGIAQSRQQQQQGRGGGMGFFPGGFGGGGFGRGFGGGGFGNNPFMDLGQMIAIGGVEGAEGVKIESVQIVPNTMTNSLLVSAPQKVMEMIENVINNMEDLEGRDVVVIKHVHLENANVEDVAPLLQEIFDASAGGAGGRGGAAGGRRSAGVSPADMGPVTISGDTRSNDIVFTAQQKDVKTVLDQIELYDIKGDFGRAQTIVLKYGDASEIARVVEATFAGGGAGGGGNRRGGGGGGRPAGGGTSSSDVRITSEATSNTIVVFASDEMRKKIVEKVEELDELYKRDIREIPVFEGNPEKIADKLLFVFGGVGGSTANAGGAAGGRGGRGGGAAAAAQLAGKIVVIGDKNSKKLYVRAPDPIFDQMSDLVLALDKADAGLQFRTFQVHHAKAQALVDSVKGAMLEYMTVAKQTDPNSDMDFDAFTAIADERTNSIMVVGSERVFDFVSQILKSADSEMPADQRKEFRVFVLSDADAATVADAVNAYAAGGGEPAAAGGGTSRGGGRGGNPLAALSKGVSIAGGNILDVTAIADVDRNAVFVIGRKQDIETASSMVIEPMTNQLTRQIETIPVKNADPSQIVSFIQQFLDSPAGGGGGQGRGGQRGGMGPNAGVPVIVPNDGARNIIVFGSRAQVDKVRTLVTQFDDKSAVDNTPIVMIPVPYDQDVTLLAQTVERLVNDGERTNAERQGRQTRTVVIQPNESSQVLMVYGDPSMTSLVRTVVDQLKDIHPSAPETVVLKLTNMTATDAQSIINDLQNRGSRATVRPTGTRGGSNGGGFNGGGFNQGGNRFTPGGNRGGGTFNPGGGNRGNGNTGFNRGGGNTDGGNRGGVRRQQPRGGGGGAPPSIEGAFNVQPIRKIDSKMGDSFIFGEPVLATLLNTPSIMFWQVVDTPAAGADAGNNSSDDADDGSAATGSAAGDEGRDPPTDPPPTNTPRPRRRPAAPDSSGAPQLQPASRSTGPVNREVDALKALQAAREPTETRKGSEQAAAPASNEATSVPSPVQSLPNINGQLRGEVLATPLDSKTIVITGDKSDVAFILKMLELVEGSTPAPVIEVIPLEYAKAALIQQNLDQVMRGLQAQHGATGDRTQQYTIIAEARSNSLIVSASEENVDLIKSLVRELDKATDGSEPKLVTLDNMRADEAANLLKPVVEQLNRVRGDTAGDQAAVQAIPRVNGLMLIGTPAEVKEMERLISSMDVEIPDSDGSFTSAQAFVVDLKNARAEDLEKTLSALIEVDRSAAGSTGAANAGGTRSGAGTGSGASLIRKLNLTGPDGQPLPPLDLDKPIRIIADPGKNSLIIYSTKKNNAALQQIVASFDTLPESADIDVKAFALKYGSAQKVAETIQKLFDESKKSLKRPAQGSDKTFKEGEMPPSPSNPAGEGLAYNVYVSFDPRSNTVFVIGRKPSVLLAAGLINEIDRSAESLGNTIHMLTFKNTDAAGMQTRLREMLDKRLDLLGSKEDAARDNAVLMVDARTNSLLVIGTEETWSMIESLATQLDALPGSSPVATQFRKLDYADSIKLANLLQSVFDKKKTARGTANDSGQNDSLSVIADSRSNSLMLVGTRDYLSEAEDYIGKLDRPMTPTTEFKVRHVLLASASNIATMLQQMVDKSRSTTGGGGAAGGGANTSQGSPIQISAEPYSNSLLMAASREDMLMLDRWIDMLDKPADGGRITRIVPLRLGKAEDMAKAATDLTKVTSGGGSGGAVTADLTVFAEPNTNSVVLVGAPQIVNDTATLLEKLDETKAKGSDSVRIFKLEQADAQDTGNLLRNILEGRSGSVNSSGGGASGGGSANAKDATSAIMLVAHHAREDGTIETLEAMRSEIKVTDDTRTNSLVVTAPSESMPLIEFLVKSLDMPPDSLRIRTFPLRNSDAAEMVTALEKIFPVSSTSSSSGGAARSQSANGEARELTLEGGATGGRQQISFTTDTRTNSVIAAGTPGYLDLVEKLVLDLDSRDVQDVATLVYHPRNNKAVDIGQAITDYSEKDKQRLQDLGDAISTSKKQSRDIIAIPSEETNRIILAYDPRRQSEILDLVRQLDQPPPQVMIQVLIVEVTMNNALELGVEFAFQDLQFTRAGANDTDTFDYVGGTDIGAAVGDLGGFTFTITGRDFNFLIRTLQTEGTLNVLSRPQIMALDNEEAKIEITNSIPVVNGTTTVAGQTQTTVSREDVGIKLTVTPQINPDGFVRMKITQEVSDVAGSSQIAAGISQPTFLKRTADTSVTVKDNETVVLGGLITTRDQVTEQKIPLIGDIPILGALFRHDVKSNDHTELLVILTPKVVRTVEDYRNLSLQERDRTGSVPADVLENPLMDGLRRTPAAEGGETPTPEAPPPSRSQDDREIYGPVREAPPAEKRRAEPASYDIPLTWAAERKDGK